MEIESKRNFKKVERSYHSTPDGWRLATCEEAMNGLESITENEVLDRWERARLLDGWISGSGYGYDIKNEFRGCMGYMLLIETHTSAENASGTPYADVKLSEFGKEVALFLCVDDWNFEVVYWLLNSWTNSHTMELSDVRGGNVPFANAAEFKKMNEGIGRLAGRLAVEEVAAREKGRTTKNSVTDSVKEVLSGMMQIVTEERGEVLSGDEYFLPGYLQTRKVVEAFWSFVCETFAGCVVEARSRENLDVICSMKTKRKSEKNLKIATSILRCLSECRSDIIHEPLPHTCSNNCAGEFLSDMEERARGDPDRFSEMLKHNALWRCYDGTGYYGVLNKLLFGVTQRLRTEGKVSGAVVDMLLKCGAEPAGCYAIQHFRENTLHNTAAYSESKDVSTEVAELLLERYDEESQTRLVNAVNEEGMTALHIASQQGNASLCKLLIKFNASVNAQDNKGMTPLHYALEQGEGDDELVNVFMKSTQISELVDLEDKRGNTPLDIAIFIEDYASTAKLLSKSKEPEGYLSKVDQDQLLRPSLLVGSPDIVKKLYGKRAKLPAGDRDEDGKTALHLAAMRDDENSAMKIIHFILPPETPERVVLVSECDRRGRTVLHEAALNGHEWCMRFLLLINPKLLYMKDRDHRNPLYDLVKGKYKGTNLTMEWLKDRDHRNPLYDLVIGKYKGTNLTMEWLNAWKVKKDMHVEDLTDRSGLTPLHVAVSHGNANFVNMFLSYTRFKENYLSRGDFLGQTGLHKAAKLGDIKMVEILLHRGAHPLRERDCDGRTALHYAVQAEKVDKQKLAEALFERCESEEEKSLLLWASAAGLGTADQNLSNKDPLRKILLQKMSDFKAKKDNNLLKMAASVGDFEMTKELIIRGYQMEEIFDSDWREALHPEERKENVTRVLKLIDAIKEQGNDRPAILDTLGRVDYAQGIAALLLNPYINPPIAVGITGTWGMGKSSLMFQAEQILLTTAAQIALLESSKLPSLALALPDIKSYKLSRKGGKICKNIYNQIMYGEKNNRNLNMKEIQKEMEKFLNKYDLKYRKVFKALAAMDSSDMFETNASRPKADPSAEENVPALLTVQYNAWKYRNDTEALAGMAVEITKELEGVMTQAQWLSTCCRNTWRKKKYNLWIEIFFPSILALVLVSSLTWVIWVVFDSDKLKAWVKTKYAWPPAAMALIVWTLTKSVMGVLKPVSTQLMQYISFPDHSEKLGYQERVISDITFLKEEIGKNAYKVFVVIGWVLSTFTVLWCLVTESLFFHHRSLGKFIGAPEVTPASGSNLRIIVFVDDLDRCQESVILQVLSAINIVLAECKINVVMGMDKRLIQRAIMKKYGDGKANRSLKTSQELADMYLQKIIQLPLDLPDPSNEESTRFLKGLLGVLQNEDKTPASAEIAPAARDIHPAHTDEESDDGGLISSEGEEEAERQNAPSQVLINMPPASEISEMVTVSPNLPEVIQHTDDRSSRRGDKEKHCSRLLKFPVRNIVCDCIYGLRALWRANTGTGPTNLRETTELTETDEDANEDAPSQTGIQQNTSSSILIREMLFVRYSQGEETAFLFFQGLVTDNRKLPREWKRLLNYHRLVWYIFSVSKDAKTLAGWQVQLIAWIFVCWEWEENMNLVITKWKEIKWTEIRDLKTSESNEPSLLMIVEYLMGEHERENQKVTAIGKEEDQSKRAEILGEARKSVSKINDNEEIGSSNLEITEGEASIAPTTDDTGIMEKDTSQKLVKEIDKLDALEKSVAELKKEMKKIKEPGSDDLKEEMKELIKQVSDELKEEMKDFKKHMTDELKKEMQQLKKESGEEEMKELKEEMAELKQQVSSDLKKEINEVREQVVKRQNNKKEQNPENEKNKLHNLENWKTMKLTLERYNVSMDGIQAFQRFRFYCIAGYLPRPSLSN